MADFDSFKCYLSILNNRRTWDVLAKPEDDCIIILILPNQIAIQSREMNLNITENAAIFEYKKTHDDTFCIKSKNEIYAVQLVEVNRVKDCEILMKNILENIKTISISSNVSPSRYASEKQQSNNHPVPMKNNYMDNKDINTMENVYDHLQYNRASSNKTNDQKFEERLSSTGSSIDHNSSVVNDKKAPEARQLSEEEKLCEDLCEFIELGDNERAVDIVKKLCQMKSKLTMYVLTNEKFVEENAHRITLTVRLESRLSNGACPIDVNPYTTTIRKLKLRMAKQLGISVACQRWITKGGMIPEDKHYLEQYGIISNNDFIYLYLASLKVQDEDDETIHNYNEKQPQRDEKPMHRVNDQTKAHPEYHQQQLQQQYFDNIREDFYPDNQQGYLGYDYQEELFYPQQMPTYGANKQWPPNPHNPYQRHPYQQQNHPYNEFTTFNSNKRFGPQTMPPNMGPRAMGQNMKPRATTRNFPQPHYINELQEEFMQKRPAGFNVNANTFGHNIQKPGWDCPQCTTRNLPTIPSCDACLGNRPPDYKVPDGYLLTPAEEFRLLKEKQDEELARKWQEDERRKEEEEARKNYRLIEQLNQLRVIPNTEMFECPICFIMIEPGEGVMLRECLHNTCRNCLAAHINASEDAEPCCPMHEGFPCPAVITQQEIQELLSEEEYQKYLDKSLKLAESQAKAFHCRTVNCKGFCFLEDEVNEFPCPICHALNCITCRAIHQDMTCKQYQDELKLQAQNNEDYKKTQQMMERMIERGDAMHCPQCEIVLQKKSGCDWMRCTMCKTEICWATKGRRWGPKGNGDTSGGCRCGVNGRRCADNCGNCH